MNPYEKRFASDSQIEEHNKEVKEVNAAYNAGKPIRVPLLMTGIPPYALIYQDEKLSFRAYHSDPEYQLRLQAQSIHYTNNIILQDAVMDHHHRNEIGAMPDYNCIMDAGYWGCPTIITDREQPRQTHPFEGVKPGLDDMALPDPFHDNMMRDVHRMYSGMKKLVRDFRPFGMTFSPQIDLMWPCITLGIFNTAVQLMGTGFFLEMYDDPEYAKMFLKKVADGYIRRSQAWLEFCIANNEPCCGRKIEGKTPGTPASTGNNNVIRSIVWDHGIDTISIDYYKAFLIPVYERIKAAFGQDGYDGSIEHCGRGEAVIRLKHKHFGVMHFNNMTSNLIDIPKLRHDLGDDVVLGVSLPAEVLNSGPVDRIHNEVKELLTPDVKGKGNLYIMDWANFLAPVENRIALYDAVREYGRY